MNCKPGDLAVVVDGGGQFQPFIENIGRTVRCLEVDHAFRKLQGPVWTVEALGGPLTVAGMYLDELEPSRIAYVEDANLRPLRPHELAQTQPRVEAPA